MDDWRFLFKEELVLLSRDSVFMRMVEEGSMLLSPELWSVDVSTGGRAYIASDESGEYDAEDVQRVAIVCWVLKREFAQRRHGSGCTSCR